ncbi:NirD/YgiW/YdeI family stress tolerance protein, partial [Salmonella enterica]|uniref:NirD/YgiW/YdeI family stress tolerance protein n=1 Tax=Salmonella enterica TaxID=28901 RepID=UPI00093969CD
RVSLSENLIEYKGDYRYVLRDKSGEINVLVSSAVFDGREVQPDQMININESLDKKEKEPLVRVNRLQK